MDFKTGDIVILKSGEPEITIEKIGLRNSNNAEIVAYRVRFEKDQTKYNRFNLASLMLVSEK